MQDGKGAHATIEFKIPDQPNEGLGYWICPDGNQDHMLNAILKDMIDFCQKVGSAFLTPQEMRQALRQRMIQKLSYKIQLSSLTEKQCRKINTQVRQHILPKLRLNRNMPSAVVYGLLEYGDMEITESHTLQDQLQTPNLM